jgi:hypothetical protein
LSGKSMPIGTCHCRCHTAVARAWRSEPALAALARAKRPKKKRPTRERFEGAGRRGRRGRWCASTRSCHLGSVESDLFCKEWSCAWTRSVQVRWSKYKYYLLINSESPYAHRIDQAIAVRKQVHLKINFLFSGGRCGIKAVNSGIEPERGFFFPPRTLLVHCVYRLKSIQQKQC